ncbi:porin [Aquabacterium sp.]|uniref:porin n=1 Tax=Aquabacterium sp. TaxID=1872578 RepID=UPI002CED47EC|nr:porin [Aquabacterium sp.]HSW04483.1 porin [Aquabacterium sp.]
MNSKAWAAVALVTTAASAQAQSTVTIFGVLDVSAKSVSTGNNTVRQLATDGLNNSRLGFRTEEDLGGGLRAGAWLESAINPDTGSINASGKFWHRRSTVSLFGAFGELRIGRDLDASFWNLSIFDPFGTCGVGSGFNLATNLGSGAATLLRADNAISYYLPSGLGGLYGQFEVAAGESVPGNAYKGGRLGYQQGALNMAVAYAATRTATSDDFKVMNAGVSYNFGVATAMALVNVSKYAAKQQANWELGVIVPVFGVAELKASYQRANASGAGTDNNDAHQVAIGYVHNLSKRTALYSAYSQLKNEGNAAFVVGSPPAAAAGKSSKGYEFGIRHAF